MLEVTVLCSDKGHPVFKYLEEWVRVQEREYNIALVNGLDQLPGGDILFLVSCNEIIKKEHRTMYQKCLVLHASDLPEGRGWSPHIWRILEGRNDVTLSLLEAEDKVDTGNVWAKKLIDFEGHELFDEINHKLFCTELELMQFAIDNFHQVEPTPQIQTDESYYRKRTPLDSELNPNQSIVESFDQLRVADPNRFPAFFYHLGKKYRVYIEKMDEE